MSKDEMINRIILGNQYTETEKHPKLLLQQKEIQQEEERLKSCLDPYLDDLKQVFQNYASYGEPVNMNTLKSSKLQKMLKDADLILIGSKKQ